MAFLGQDEPHIDEAVRKMEAASSAAQFRDQVWETQGQTAAWRIGGTIVGMYLVYRFLFKR